MEILCIIKCQNDGCFARAQDDFREFLRCSEDVVDVADREHPILKLKVVKMLKNTVEFMLCYAWLLMP